LRRIFRSHKPWLIGAALGFTVAVAGADLVAVDPASSPAAAQIRVKLASAAGEPLAGEGFVVFKGQSASAAPIVVPVKLPGTAAAGLPAGSQWTLIADFPGYFAADSVLQVPREALAAPLEVQVTLRPAGTLTGKFVAEGKEKLPERLEARFEPTREPPPRKQDVPAGLATCAVDSSGDWRCRLPAGRLDIALHPKGFIPQYVWNHEVKAGETGSLGSRKLVRGASVAGWVTREDGTPAEKCRVRIEPAMAPGYERDPTLEFLRTVAREVPCQKMGFFQSAALAAGSYVLVAQENEARAQLSPVQVWEGAESRLTAPIVLRRPADFELTLSPPVDWLGQPWRVEARRAREHRTGWEEPPYRAEASQDGLVRLPKQLPGRYWITVHDRIGNALFSDLDVELSDPAQPYPVTLDLLWVEGTVHLGDQPVAGRLFFGGRNGTIRIEMASNESGRFEGPLPRPGIWRVEVEGDEPRLKTKTRVEVQSKGNRASVSIELPDTVVSGRVIDPEGAPARGADVALGSVLGMTALTQTDENGEFELRYFPKGTNELSASQSAGRGEDEVSDVYRFEAAEDQPHGPVTLTLRRNRAIRGRVMAATGPVIGATLSAWPTIGGDGGIQTVRSRLAGDFELKVPEGTQALRVVVSPPGGALKAYEVNVANGADLLFQVEPQGGELLITLGKSGPADDETPVLWQEDLWIPSGALKEWAEGHGGRFRQGNRMHLPQLAPGYYTVCVGAPAAVLSNELAAWKSRTRCATGYLAAASTLDLHIPDS
jgi:hypothetical protein